MPRLIQNSFLFGLAALTSGASPAIAASLAPGYESNPGQATREADRDDSESRRRGDRSSSEPRVPSEEEWQAAVAVLRSHSPTRLHLYTHFEESMRERATRDAQRDAAEAGVEAQQVDVASLRPIRGLRARIFHRIESLWKLEKEDPEFYTFSLEQLTAEDDILAAMLERRRHRGTDQQAQADAAVDAALTRYVERILAERQGRIDRLAAELERERELLEHDRSRASELKEKLHERYERYLPPERDRDNRDADRNRSRDGARSGAGGSGN